MKAADIRGGHGRVKFTELEYENAHPGEIARHRTEAKAQRDFAVEVGARMCAEQGAGSEV
jgi:hypothetical protein